MLRDEPYLYRLTEFDERVFRQFLPKDHLLVTAEREIDWEAFQPTLAEYYSRDLGPPALDPVRMLKLEFLRYWYQLSDRQVLLRLETDLSFRWFLQVGHRFWMPDASSLCRFRGRLGEKGFAAVFDQLVSQARQLGLVKDRLRLKDASHVVANIAVPTTLKLVAQIRDRLLEALEPFDAEWVSGQRLEVNLLRQRTQDQDAEARLATRVAHLQELVAWAESLAAPSVDERDSTTDAAWQHLQQTLVLAQKILQDRQPNAMHKTLSTHDPDARRGRHGEYYDGYLVDVLVDADSTIVTQINVLEAGGDEAGDAVQMVLAEQKAHGNQIENLSIDGIGFHGPMLRELEGPVATPEARHDVPADPLSNPVAPREAPMGLGVKVFVPPKTDLNEGRFTNADFILNADGASATCPAGQTSTSTYYHTTNHMTTFRFSRATCEACPLKERCLAPTKKRVTGRTVCKNDYDQEYSRVRQRAKTAEFAAVRREHPAVERKLNELMNHHDGRHAKYWGRVKVHIQELMTGFVVNTKHMIRLLLAPLRAELTENGAIPT